MLSTADSMLLHQLSTIDHTLHQLSSTDCTLHHKLSTTDHTLHHQLSTTDSTPLQLFASNSTLLHQLSTVYTIFISTMYLINEMLLLSAMKSYLEMVAGAVCL